MGQYFISYNFTRGERLLGTNYCGSIDELYSSCPPNAFLKLLAQPIWKDPPEYIENNPNSMGMLNMATELLDMIFKNIDDFVDAMCFAVAHPRLMAIGEMHLRSLYSPQIVSPWSDCRIIILGEHATRKDLPSASWNTLSPYTRQGGGMFSISYSLIEEFNARDAEAEMKEILMLKSRVISHRIEHSTKKMKKRGGPKWTRKKASASNKAREPMTQEKKGREACIAQTEPDWDIVKGFVARATFPSGKNDHWVLCNLSKSVYVQRDYLAMKNRTEDDRSGPGYECRGRFGLGSVLLMNTQCGMGIRRPWAGDRFLVITLSELEKRYGAKYKNLKDVSEEVYDELKKSGIGA